MKKDKLRSIIMKTVLQKGEASRPELVKAAGVRAASVFEAVDALKRKGILHEPERTGKRTGRKAPLLKLNPDHLLTVGIDFEVRKTIASVVDMAGNELYSAELPAQERGTLKSCRNEIRSVVRMLEKKAGSQWNKVAGIGFADPGLVDIREKLSIRAVNVPGWENFRTGEWLTQEYGIPAGVWPEGMVKTYMEYLVRGKEISGSLFHLCMDDGIGGGFIKNGECFVGDTNQAMEIGHIVIDPAGPLCQCGNRGCLEALAGENGIRRRIREVIGSGVDTVLNLEQFSIPYFTECAKYDKAARIIANEVSDSIGRGLAVAVALLNPSVIVLNGELAGLGDLLLDSIRRVLNLSCFSDAVRDLKLEFSKQGKNDTARGAALLMRNRLLQDEFHECGGRDF